jgi:hypothetical protein
MDGQLFMEKKNLELKNPAMGLVMRIKGRVSSSQPPKPTMQFPIKRSHHSGIHSRFK